MFMVRMAKFSGKLHLIAEKGASNTLMIDVLLGGSKKHRC